MNTLVARAIAVERSERPQIPTFERLTRVLAVLGSVYGNICSHPVDGAPAQIDQLGSP
jgi:hypothetical protein